MGKINLFWPAGHGQIYPLLTKLEQEGLITFERVEQTEKPDKKVYTLMDKGGDALKMWLTSPTAEPSIRDELMLKSFCIHLLDPLEAKGIFMDRIQLYEKKLKIYENRLKELEKIKPIAFGSPNFGIYILLNNGIMGAEMRIKWCNWVLSILP
jgi:DNA-binding PadR family transcriptional regulator